MRQLNRIILSVLLIFSVLMVNKPYICATETLYTTFKTTGSGGPFLYYAFAVWLEDSNGNFVRTLGLFTRWYWYDLRDWVLTSGYDVTDAITGASSNDYNQTHSINADISDLPDETYRIQMESTDWEYPGPNDNNRATFTFNKNGTSSIQNTSGGGFKNVTIDYSGRTGGNNQPGVYAGPDQNISLPNPAILQGKVTDDGLPSSQLTTTWSKIDGPGAVNFYEPSIATTTVGFSKEGIYTLRLTADDTSLQTSDDVKINVNTMVLTPVADSGVSAGANAGLNFGTVQKVFIRNDGGGSTLTNEVYMRFDLSSVPNNISYATLRLAIGEAGGTDTTRKIREVSNDTWGETSITWNTKPSPGTDIGTFIAASQMMEVDVSNYIITNYNDNKLASMNIYKQGITADWVQYNTRETYVTPQLLVAYAPANPNNPPNAPTNLLCNGTSNPGGISDFMPDLSWTFSDSDTGNTQGAYRILVANSQSALDSDNGNMWDTNKVPSASNNVTYSGTQLQSNNTYYWKVTTWDNLHAQGPYSQTATFSMSGQMASDITVTSPNGGETWQVDTQQTVTWTSQGTVGNVNIELSTDSGTNWISLVTNSTNDGSETITTPDSPSTFCRIRVEDVSGPPGPSDMSNSNFTIEVNSPAISVNKTILDFGNIRIGESDTLDFQITNTGGGILSGTISSNKKWIAVAPATFQSNSVTVNVTADNNILYEKSGQHTGTVSITSNGGNRDIAVQLAATCVLVKPNPYDPTKGNLTFFGDGIVPDETTIRIYTLSGELVKTLNSGDVERSEILLWRGKNEKGKTVINGIYIYVYDSTKEHGIGKFTVTKQ